MEDEILKELVAVRKELALANEISRLKEETKHQNFESSEIKGMYENMFKKSRQ